MRASLSMRRSSSRAPPRRRRASRPGDRSPRRRVVGELSSASPSRASRAPPPSNPCSRPIGVEAAAHGAAELRGEGASASSHIGPASGFLPTRQRLATNSHRGTASALLSSSVRPSGLWRSGAEALQRVDARSAISRSESASLKTRARGRALCAARFAKEQRPAHSGSPGRPRRGGPAIASSAASGGGGPRRLASSFHARRPAPPSSLTAGRYVGSASITACVHIAGSSMRPSQPRRGCRRSLAVGLVACEDVRRLRPR